VRVISGSRGAVVQRAGHAEVALFARLWPQRGTTGDGNCAAVSHAPPLRVTRGGGPRYSACRNRTTEVDISKLTRSCLGLAILAALASLTACAPKVSVKVGWNEHTDFAPYRTWGWRPDGSIRDPVWEQRCHSVLADELAVHGLKEVPPESADLWAVVHARLTADTRVATFANDWGYGWGPYGNAWAYDQAVEYQVPVGTIILDLVDAKQKLIVWRGRASGDLQTGKTNEEREQKLISVLKQMFAVFPPIPKNAAESTYKPR
jgi:hypothetical protein